MDFESPAITSPTDRPHFSTEASQIMKVLKTKSKNDLTKLMKTGPEITDKVAKDIKAWSNRVSHTKSKAAIDAFAGVVYQGLNASELGNNERNEAQKKIRIISGLYGVLKPFDAIQQYRLEMKTALKVGQHRNLYQFWGNSISKSLEKEKPGLIVNLTSKEYSRTVSKDIADKVISLDFKNRRNGQLKNLSYHAKLARGVMARSVINKKIESLAEVKKIEIQAYPHTYLFDEEASDESNWVFVADG